MVGSLIGGKVSSDPAASQLDRLTFTSGSTPGFQVGNPQGQLVIGRNAPLAQSLKQLRDSGSQAGRNVLGLRRNLIPQLEALRGQVTPGFGRLTEARVRAVENARRRGIGNLRENLSQRRISGSSFAQDAIGRLEREFGEAEANVRAQSFLEELDLNTRLLNQQIEQTSRLIQQEFSLSNTGNLAEIDQSRFEFSAFTQLATGFTSAAAGNAAVMNQIEQLRFQESGRIGEFVTTAGVLAGGALAGSGFFAGTAGAETGLGSFNRQNAQLLRGV